MWNQIRRTLPSRSTKRTSTLARDVTGTSKLARDCDRFELRPYLPKLRLVEQGTEDPEHPTVNKYSNTQLRTTY